MFRWPIGIDRCLVLLTLCSATLTAQAPDWTEKKPANSPLARTGHAMAYDAARGQVVLFGGTSGDSYFNNFNDTWVWDGSNWTQKWPVNSPPAHTAHSMAYDAARGETVLFGGHDGNSPLSDTWVWDGSNWTQKWPVNSPPLRAYQAMSYDAARGQVVLFGGHNGNSYFNDTWVWDGNNWMRKSPASSPAARNYHAMAYDAARGQVVLFGGRDMSTLYPDTWVWDGNDWTQKWPASSPTPRVRPAMVYDAVRGEVVVFGGALMGPFGWYGDTWVWVWNGTNWAQKSPASSPTLRVYHAMAYDAARGQTVLFGGAGMSYPYTRDDTWVWPSDSTGTTPLILSISPTSGPPGTAITISGGQFGPVQGSSVVRLGSLSALVTSWNNTQIQAVVPFVASLNLSYDLSVSTPQGTGNEVSFLVTGSNGGQGMQPPGKTGVQPCPGPNGQRMALVPQSTTGFSVLLVAKEVTICSKPDELTTDITLENNWKAWYFVSILPTGGAGAGLPQTFLIGPGGKRTFRLTFKRGEQVAFFADASFRTPPSAMTAQDWWLLGAFGSEFAWRLWRGSPLPQGFVDSVLVGASVLDPTHGFIALGIAVAQNNIPGIVKAIERIRDDPFLSTQLTAFGIPIAQFSVIKLATRLYYILDLLTNEFIAAVSRPNDTLTIRAQ